MTGRKPNFKRVIFIAFAAAFFLMSFATLLHGSSDSISLNRKTPLWERDLPAVSCPWSSSDTNCHHASPALADITGDGMQEIIVATNKGNVLVYRHDGELVWNTDIGPAFGMSAGTQWVSASPAVADLDGDGKMEVVVGTGSIYPQICSQGGIIVLDHLGKPKAGWPFFTQDDGIPPEGCRDTVFATPALGDLDNDGDLEIVFGSFDERFYALHHDGRAVSGFPIDSYHYARFGWDNLKGELADTVWSSPALADLDDDGFLDIVTGADEGNFDNTFPNPPGVWTCPLPVHHETKGYCGGSLYAIDRSGQILEGFPRYIHETIQSTPAIMDINGDGQNEIFVGTGSFYYRNSAELHYNLGFRLFGLDSRGNDLPGWEGGKVVKGVVPASPSIGDITGDGQPNIVVAALDQMLYAWHADGKLVSGFPMVPRTSAGDVLDSYDVGTNFILADYTGDGKMEIFLRHSSEIVIVNGIGHQLTATHWSDTQPSYMTDRLLLNNPAVGDLNSDGHLELVVQNSKLIVWDLPTSTTSADWPMFKFDAARNSARLPAVVKVGPEEIFLMVEAGQADVYRRSVYISSTLGKFDWKVSSDSPDITFPQTSGVGHGKEVIGVDVHVSSGLSIGDHLLGKIEVVVSQDGSDDMSKIVPVKVMVVQELSQIFLPSIH